VERGRNLLIPMVSIQQLRPRQARFVPMIVQLKRVMRERPSNFCIVSAQHLLFGQAANFELVASYSYTQKILAFPTATPSKMSLGQSNVWQLELVERKLLPSKA